MTTLQKVIKYLAIAFAIFLTLSIIGGILGVLRGFFPGDDVTGELKTYAVTGEIKTLSVQIAAADFRIKEGDTFSVESNLAKLTVKEKDGCLTVEDQTKAKADGFDDAVLTIFVPAGTVFDSITIKTGAGRFTAEQLSAETVDFELGAGDVSIDSLVATKSADIEGGAGRITIVGGALKDLDLDMGVGQLNLTSALTGSCQLDLGVGESNITLLGSKADYTLDLQKGLGGIQVDGQAVSDGNSGSGPSKVKINGGVGSIHVNFKEQEVK